MPDDNKPSEETSTTLVNLDPPDTGFTPDPGVDTRHTLSEGIDKQEVKLEDFKSILESKDPNLIPPKPDEKKTNEKTDAKPEGLEQPEKSKEDVKGEPESVDKEAKGTEGVRDAKQEIPTIPSQVETDEQKYGEQASKFFPKMDKTAREYFKARLSDLEEVKAKLKSSEETIAKQVGDLPSSYLDHPEAYKLDPKYSSSLANIQNLQNEIDIWTNALVACKAGDKWQMPTGRDTNGNILYKEMEASSQGEVHIERVIQKGMQMLDRNQQVIENLSTQFKAGHDKQKKEMQDLAAYYFPNYVGDKGKDNKYIKTMNSILEEKGQKDNQLKPFVNYLYALMMEQGEYIKANEAKWKTADKPKVVKQPNSGDINNAGGDKKVGIEHKPFNMDEFQKEMA